MLKKAAGDSRQRLQTSAGRVPKFAYALPLEMSLNGGKLSLVDPLKIRDHMHHSNIRFPPVR